MLRCYWYICVYQIPYVYTFISAVIGDNSILLSFSDDHRPAILSLERIKSSGIPHPLALTQTDSGKKLEKISNVDPKVKCTYTLIKTPPLIRTLYFFCFSLHFITIASKSLPYHLKPGAYELPLSAAHMLLLKLKFLHVLQNTICKIGCVLYCISTISHYTVHREVWLYIKFACFFLLQLDFAHVRGLPVTGTLKQVRVNNVGDLAVFWWKKKSTHLRTTHNMVLFTINR